VAQGGLNLKGTHVLWAPLASARDGALHRCTAHVGAAYDDHALPELASDLSVPFSFDCGEQLSHTGRQPEERHGVSV
jgi:hypothetical protein